MFGAGVGLTEEQPKGTFWAIEMLLPGYDGGDTGVR